MRVLFVNQGVIGGRVLGLAQAEEMLRLGLAERPEAEAHFVRLAPWTLAARLAGGRVPGLHAVGLDLHVPRWHAVEALRGRAVARREIAAFRPDVVHLLTQSLALGLLREPRRVPVVLSLDATVRDWQALTHRHWGQRRTEIGLRPVLAAERRALEQAALVLAWSEWTRRGVLATAPQASVRVLHPGIDLVAYHPAPRRPRPRPRVLFVGGRFEEKGGMDLLAALGPWLGEHVELDVVTRGPVPARAGVRVHRLDPGPSLIDLFQQADVFCLPTLADSTALVVVEAMACGAAVVATKVGAIPEHLGDDEAGLLVAPRSPVELRAALQSLLADAARRRALGARARAVVEERHDARRQGVALVAALEDARRRHKGRG